MRKKIRIVLHTIVCKNYKKIDIDKFMRMIECKVNILEGNNVDLANLTINPIVKS